MYAVIETGGKQYKVENGDIVFVEKLSAADDSTVDFKVVAVGGEDGLKIGTPYVDGASVTGKVLKTGKGKKITVMTYKPKKGEKRKMGHRQPYTKAVSYTHLDVYKRQLHHRRTDPGHHRRKALLCDFLSRRYVLEGSHKDPLHKRGRPGNLRRHHRRTAGRHNNGQNP